MEIWPSARKWDVPDEDLLHAARHVIVQVPAESAGPNTFRMWIGPARNGDLLEIGIVYLPEIEAIAHGKDLRPGYYQFLPHTR